MRSGDSLEEMECSYIGADTGLARNERSEVIELTLKIIDKEQVQGIPGVVVWDDVAVLDTDRRRIGFKVDVQIGFVVVVGNVDNTGVEVAVLIRIARPNDAVPDCIVVANLYKDRIDTAKFVVIGPSVRETTDDP